MSHSPLPPPPFSDFEFTFDPSLSNLFPNPPPLPSSADLFSPSETTDLLGFLDNFGDFAWDLNGAPKEYPPEQKPQYDHATNTVAPYSNPHLHTIPEPSTSSRPKSGGARNNGSRRGAQQQQEESTMRETSQTRSTASDSSSANTPTFSADGMRAPAVRSRLLLSTPQKRLNHIMSEQKRRNAIRDGYGQLIALMAPAGSAPGIGMPTRGRPKGSGSRGKGQTKGKSGVLFRAVEYCRWLEEGQDALQQEVLRVEAAAATLQLS